MGLLEAPPGNNLGRNLGLLALDVGDFALAVNHLDASLLQLGNRVALHLGLVRKRLLRTTATTTSTTRSSTSTIRASLAHALLCATPPAHLVLARHLLPRDGQTRARDNLPGSGAVRARLVHLLGRHAALLAGNGRRRRRLGVLHGDGGHVRHDGDARRRGLGPVVPAAEGVEPRRDVLPQGLDLALLALQLLVRLADVRVWVGVLDVLLLVHLRQALARLAVVQLDHAAARPARHRLRVRPPPEHLVKLLREDAPLDHVLDALRHLGRDDGHRLADVLKVEVLLQERVEGAIGGGGFSGERPFALRHRRGFQLANLLGQLGLSSLRIFRVVILRLVVEEVSAHIRHGPVDVLLGGLLGLEADALLGLAAFALAGRRRKEVLVVDAVCVEVQAFVVRGLVVVKLIVARALRRVKSHVAECWAILLFVLVFVVLRLAIAAGLFGAGVGLSHGVCVPVYLFVVAGSVGVGVASCVLLFKVLRLPVELVNVEEAVVEAVGVFDVFLAVLLLFLFILFLVFVLVESIKFLFEAILKCVNVFFIFAFQVAILQLVLIQLGIKLIFILVILYIVFILALNLLTIIKAISLLPSNNLPLLLQLIQHAPRKLQDARNDPPRLLPHLFRLKAVHIHLPQLQHLNLIPPPSAAFPLALPALLQPRLLLLANLRCEALQRFLHHVERARGEGVVRLQEDVPRLGTQAFEQAQQRLVVVRAIGV
ncbi:hypothetical protein CCMA1212_003475 [Trichoderma ghanense]|uniref:Uncharacterized protein n=1 Tax=Trichoderma ghanense TaxID=65468 RepID=A0ABY2H8Y6_9HYPO